MEKTLGTGTGGRKTETHDVAAGKQVSLGRTVLEPPATRHERAQAPV